MPRFNIEHKGKYYIFSSISDGIIEEFDTFKELQQYRLLEYGRQNYENEKTFKDLRGNKDELKNVLSSMVCGGNEEKENIIKYFSLLDKKDMIYAYKDIIDLAYDLLDNK
jgi:hypothetical protein